MNPSEVAPMVSVEAGAVLRTNRPTSRLRRWQRASRCVSAKPAATSTIRIAVIAFASIVAWQVPIQPSSGGASLWLPDSRVDDGPKMYDPAQENDPHCRREHELENGHQESTLEQLAQSGDEEAAQRCDNVSS